jgi:DNA replication protein DnaC
MTTIATSCPDDDLLILLRGLKLPSFVTRYPELAERGEREGWSFVEFLRELALHEHRDRKERRIERLLRRSQLPPDKTLATLKLSRLPTSIRRQVPVLCEGTFLRDATNILAFGLPGRGKSHLAAAIGHELVQRGIPVLFTSTFALVERLLGAKRELTLDKMLRRLDAFETVILDDLGYVQQGRDEMEVLFTFLAERYERRSVIITSNLVFSEWDRIFKDAMTTAAAIDRVVHHSVILELTGPSYRKEQADGRKPRRKDKKTSDDKPDESDEG